MKGPFINGDNIGYTDYVLWELLECLVVHAPDCLQPHPLLKVLVHPTTSAAPHSRTSCATSCAFRVPRQGPESSS